MSNIIAFPSRSARRRLVVVGNGMATSKLLDEFEAHLPRFRITVVGDEARPCYNRVLLSRLLAGAEVADLVLKDEGWYTKRGISLVAGVRALHADLDARVVMCSDGQALGFDDLVLATGSRALVPPIEGLRDDDSLKPGVFVFRTLDDAEAIRDFVEPGMRAVVLGGGLLGLEAAKGLHDLGARVTVVDRSPGLMPRQLDPRGGRHLADQLASMGIATELEASARRINGETELEGVVLDNGTELGCDILVLACGIQPRVEVARSSGFPIRRAILVDDDLKVQGLRNVYAVGECAEHRGQVHGIVAPIWDQVTRLARVLTGGSVAPSVDVKPYARLKVAGVDVASLGEIEPREEEDDVLIVEQPRARRYTKLILRGDQLVGAQFVGDTSAAPRLVHLWEREEPVPPNPLDLLCSDDVVSRGLSTDQREICSCARVSESVIIEAVQQGASTLQEIGRRTGATTGCGSCRSSVESLLEQHSEPTCSSQAVI